MDDNTTFIISNSGPSERWEDQEKAFYETERLREEFVRRLYKNPPGTIEGYCHLQPQLQTIPEPIR